MTKLQGFTLYLFSTGNTEFVNGALKADAVLHGFETFADVTDYVYDLELPGKCHTINIYDHNTGRHWSYEHDQDIFECDDEDDSDALFETVVRAVPGDQSEVVRKAFEIYRDITNPAKGTDT